MNANIRKSKTQIVTGLTQLFQPQMVSGRKTVWDKRGETPKVLLTVLTLEDDYNDDDDDDDDDGGGVDDDDDDEDEE